MPTNITGGFLVNGVSVNNGAPVMGKEYHVRKTADVHYDEWYNGAHFFHHDGTDSVHTTITSALDVADDFDTIWVYPGQYKEPATLSITQDNFRLLAVQTGPNTALTRTEIRTYDSVAAHCITMNAAHNVEIAGFRITPHDAGGYFGIMMGNTAACYGSYVHDNYFYCGIGGDPGASAMSIGDSGFDCDSFYVSNNRFYLGGDKDTPYGIIDWKLGTRGNIIGNHFWQYSNNATNYALNITDNTGFRGHILDNRFTFGEIGVSQGVAVAINNPAVSGGDCIISGNEFVNYYAVANCIANIGDECVGINYYEDDAINAG